MSDYSIDGMIRYFEMAHKVMGWTSTDNSYEHKVAEMLKKLRDERDDARLRTGRILNEIDCRIEHGADSNGHLEAIRNLFKENTND